MLLLGFTLLAIAGLDVYFLQSLARMAKATLSVTDDTIFVSEVSFALYVLPVMFGGGRTIEYPGLSLDASAVK